jgi:amidase
MMANDTALVIEQPTAIQIAADVRAGRRTPADVVETYLARIAAVDGRIGALQDSCQAAVAAAARRDAAALADRPDLGDLPLAGVPVAVKDNVAVAGLPTRYGSAATPSGPAPRDDELVRRLRAAGALIVGKTRLPELAIWGFTESTAYGGTRNPRDPGRNAGGSTGGGAAAVAAGLAPLALGSDGGGSLRIPAANCGVVGFKPARGVVPLAGGRAEHWYGCTEFGAIAATVADVALATAVLAGADPAAAVASASGAPQPMRIAVSTRSPSPLGRPDATAVAAVRAAADRAEAHGHRVVRAHPPYPMTLINQWARHWLAGVAQEVDDLGLAMDALEPRTRAVLRRGQRLRRRGLPAPEPALAWRRRVLDWLSGYDLLVTPVVARPAPAAGWAEGGGYGRAYLNGARCVPFTQAWNLAGIPALSLPMGSGFGSGAVQLICAPGREATLLAVAAQLAA